MPWERWRSLDPWAWYKGRETGDTEQKTGLRSRAERGQFTATHCAFCFCWSWHRLSESLCGWTFEHSFIPLTILLQSVHLMGLDFLCDRFLEDTLTCSCPPPPTPFPLESLQPTQLTWASGNCSCRSRRVCGTESQLETRQWAAWCFFSFSSSLFYIAI